MWYKRVQKFVTDSRGKIYVTDQALFMWHKNKNLISVISVHVDMNSYVQKTNFSSII